LIRRLPEKFGTADLQTVYSAVAKAIYAPKMAANFAYVHWNETYQLKTVTDAYAAAFRLTNGFKKVDVKSLADFIKTDPRIVRVFRLLLGFTSSEFAASTNVVAEELETKPITAATINSLELGRKASEKAAQLCAAVVDRAMRKALFPGPPAGQKQKIEKPDTNSGRPSVRRFAADGVPLSVFLHQRHYGGAFRQLLDSTSTQRGDEIENAVEDVFNSNGIRYVRTGSGNQEEIVRRFNLSVTPAPDFVVHDSRETLRAMLECKAANDGGSARDKAARFNSLRQEAIRLGGIPVFAVLAGLGWRRTRDALGPVIRATDGRTFSLSNLEEVLTVTPFPELSRPSRG
jgi:hypothetical protein